MTQREDVEQRLSRLARETAELVPSPSFSDRVMLAIAAEAALAFQIGVSRSARRVIAAAALIALGALSWAVKSDDSANASMAADYTALELE